MLKQSTQKLSTSGITRSVLQRKCACGDRSSGECEECRKKKSSGLLQRYADTDQVVANVSPLVDDVLNSPGQSLDTDTRSFMEPRFGHDFSQIRIHTDSKARESARAVNAFAYTVGNNVVFDRGRYSPETSDGRRLLAHELTHTVQQSQNSILSRSGPMRISESGDAHEREAEAVADRVVAASANDIATPKTSTASSMVQRHSGPTVVPPYSDFAIDCELPSDASQTPVETLHFGNGSSLLSELDRQQIDNFVTNWHASATKAPVRVDGYASTRGASKLNWTLSCARANAVADELINPSSGNPGIPEPLVRTVAHGATSEFGTDSKSASTAEAENRRVTISAAIDVPPQPVPPQLDQPPKSPEAKRFCGPNVTTEVIDAVSKVKSKWTTWTDNQKYRACDSLVVPPMAFVAWDINELHSIGDWIPYLRPMCATFGEEPSCASSVQINKGCHYAGSVNYVIFGAMCRLCAVHDAQHMSISAMLFTEDMVRHWISMYKHFPNPANPSPNLEAAKAWAVAGYQGWPSVGDPGPDRSNCELECKGSYYGGPFKVHWVPMGWF